MLRDLFDPPDPLGKLLVSLAAVVGFVLLMTWLAGPPGPNDAPPCTADSTEERCIDEGG